MSSSERAVFLGAVGWQHPSWQTVFYPEDLPEDWRLAYYNTQYWSVFLPYADWVTTTGAQLMHWVEDTQPGFRFVLESGPSSSAHPHIAGILGERLAMITQRDDPRLLWFDAGSDLKVLSREIDRRDKPLYLFSRDADLATLHRVHTLLELMGW